MLSLVASHMKRLGFTVHEAPDGAAAWKLVQDHVPDLVMLDVMMPEMSGWEVARAIKGKAGAGGVFEHTPVLMLTGIGERLNAMNSPLFAADAWLDKPFEFTTLDDQIAEALGKHGKKIPSPSATATPVGSDKPVKVAAKKSSAKKVPAKKAAAPKPEAKASKATKAAPAKAAAVAKPVAKKAAPAAPAKPVAKKAAPAKTAAPAKKAAPVKAASKPAKKSASKAPVKAAAKSPAKKSTRRG